jgi:hypothetical protein
MGGAFRAIFNFTNLSDPGQKLQKKFTINIDDL